MQQSSLNKHRPLPGIKSPTDEAASSQPYELDVVDGDDRPKTDAIETIAATADERKSQTTTGPTTTAYKLKDLPLAKVIGEVELRINRLKTFDKFSNSDCSDDLRYLSAATKCGSNPEVKFVCL